MGRPVREEVVEDEEGLEAVEEVEGEALIDPPIPAPSLEEVVAAAHRRRVELSRNQ